MDCQFNKTSKIMEIGINEKNRISTHKLTVLKKDDITKL